MGCIYLTRCPQHEQSTPGLEGRSLALSRPPIPPIIMIDTGMSSCWWVSPSTLSLSINPDKIQNFEKTPPLPAISRVKKIKARSNVKVSSIERAYTLNIHQMNASSMCHETSQVVTSNFRCTDISFSSPPILVSNNSDQPYKHSARGLKYLCKVRESCFVVMPIATVSLLPSRAT